MSKGVSQNGWMTKPDVSRIDALRRSGQVFSGSETAMYTPPRREFCRRCNRNTETVLLPLSSGHVGRCCKQCRTCRPGRPYASKHEYRQHLQAATRQQGDACYDHNSIL